MSPPQAGSYPPPIDTDPEEGLDAAQAIVLCCFGSPATAWVVFKSVQHDKKAEHACYLFFVPMILGVIAWIFIMIMIIALIPWSSIPTYPYF